MMKKPILSACLIAASASLCAAVTPAIYFDFDNNSLANLGTAGGVGTLVNADANTEFVAGAPGGGSPSGALQLNGVSDFITTAITPTSIGMTLNTTGPGPNPMSDYTMSAWVNWSQTNGAGDQFIFGQTGGNGLHDGIRGSNWHMGHWGQDLAAGGANAPLADGNWQHVTFRYQDGVSQILVNGVLAASGTRGGFQPNNPFIIGTRQNSVNHDFQGVLDEVAIYPTALADFQVQLLANGHNAIIPEPTRAFTLLAGLGAMLIRRRR